MSNPTIQFRINPYHLARGLQILRSLEPNYTPASLSAIVKALYIDYCAKMNMNRQDKVSPEIWQEIDILAKPRIKEKPLSLAEIISHTQQDSAKDPIKAIEQIKQPQDLETQSDKSVVTDFSPPDWEDLNKGE